MRDDVKKPRDPGKGEEFSPSPLSIIMPCLNEEQNICAALRESLSDLTKNNINGEIIVVNDGSTDRTLEIVESVASTDNRVRIIDKKRNEGIGKAFWDGVIMSANPFVVMVPGDNENSASEVLSFYYLTRDVDIIVPFVLNVGIRSIRRRFISSLYRLIVNISFGTTLNYTNGLVIYNKVALRTVNLRTSGFFYQTELLVKLLRRGFLYAEVPHYLSKRKGGKSKALTFRSFIELSWSFLLLFTDIHIFRVEGNRRLAAIAAPNGTVTQKKADELQKSTGV